ncbi:hypothetical protein HY213_00590 [Candidatus Peregrinibacteria bacterium]|nr:hypothetical protein [Candidatus Peregrinibacteria bacterium]
MADFEKEHRQLETQVQTVKNAQEKKMDDLKNIKDEIAKKIAEIDAMATKEKNDAIKKTRDSFAKLLSEVETMILDIAAQAKPDEEEAKEEPNRVEKTVEELQTKHPTLKIIGDKVGAFFKWIGDGFSYLMKKFSGLPEPVQEAVGVAAIGTPILGAVLLKMRKGKPQDLVSIKRNLGTTKIQMNKGDMTNEVETFAGHAADVGKTPGALAREVAALLKHPKQIDFPALNAKTNAFIQSGVIKATTVAATANPPPLSRAA